jgi:4-hydroxybenzoate polyprenyltransferase
MGLCRGLNLLLGISILPPAVSQYAWIAVFPILYISAITLISRGEVHGSKRTPLYTAAIFYLAVITAISWIAFTKNNIQYAAWFIILFGIMIGMPLGKAIREPVGKNIGGAVKAGVLAVILMNAAWAAAFGALGWALLIVCLLPISILLARLFAVT